VGVKRFIFLIVLIAILVGGGIITAQLASTTGLQVLPAAKIQTGDPEASVFVATGWQAQQFFLMIGFIVINLIGIGVTLALVFWFLSRQVAIARATDAPGKAEGKSTAIEPAD
jgi:hypothetical protein